MWHVIVIAKMATLGILRVVLLMDKDFVPKNLDCISYLILYITFDILYDSIVCW